MCVAAGPAEESDLADFTPSFLWLLRDFYLTLEEDGRKVLKPLFLHLLPYRHSCCVRRLQCKGSLHCPCLHGDVWASGSWEVLHDGKLSGLTD